MKTLAIVMAGAGAVTCFSVPAMAQPVHDEDHGELDGEHAAAHGQLGAIHEEEHEEGLTPWEHQRLHRQLGRVHERADTNIEYQQELEHQNQAYQNRSYNGYGYNGYERGNGYYGSNTHSYYFQRRAQPVVRYYRYYNGHRRY